VYISCNLWGKKTYIIASFIKPKDKKIIVNNNIVKTLIS